MVTMRRFTLAFLVLPLALPLALRSQSAGDHFKAGRAAYAANNADAAVKSFERAVSLDDKNAEYHLWLGRAVGSVAQNANVLRQPFLAKRVKAEFERTVQLDASNLGGHDGLMQFYLQAPGIIGGSLSKAREEAEAIARISPLRGHFARATIAIHEKDLATAEHEDRGAVNEFPDTLAAVATLANLLANNHRGDEAFAVLDKYLARKPGDVLALWWVGRVAAITGMQLERGEQALRTILVAPGVGVDPNLPVPANIHFRLGDIFAKKGAKEQARKEYEKAIELNPQLDAARKALKAL
jgi:tetratricopeptide (TPR) repeat protein